MSQIKNKFIPNLEIALGKLNQSSAVSGDRAQWNGSFWVPVTNIPVIYEATATVASTGTANTIATGYTVTPPAGTYLVIVSARIESNSSNSYGTAQLFVGGTAQTATLRSFGAQSTNFRNTIHMIKQVTINGSQAVDFRWSHSAGGFNLMDRSIVCQRLY